MSVVTSPGVIIRISLGGTALAVMMSVVTSRPLQTSSVTSSVLVASVVLRIASLIASHHHMASSSSSSLARQVTGLGLPSVGQGLGLQLQVEAGGAGVLGGPGGTEGGGACGNNLEAGPETSHQVSSCSALGTGEEGRGS